ncbi:unnamed protein product [Calypogeia fissa]
MRVWRRFKSWVKRTVVRCFVKFARTRFARFVRRVGEASAVPLAITGAGALIGTGVASAAVLPLAYGALIGAGVAMVAIAGKKLADKRAEEDRMQKRQRQNYTIWSKKEKAKGRSYIVETSSPIGLF